jgi:hypothetical protein
MASGILRSIVERNSSCLNLVLGFAVLVNGNASAEVCAGSCFMKYSIVEVVSWKKDLR